MSTRTLTAIGGVLVLAGSSLVLALLASHLGRDNSPQIAEYQQTVATIDAVEYRRPADATSRPVEGLVLERNVALPPEPAPTAVPFGVADGESQTIPAVPPPALPKFAEGSASKSLRNRDFPRTHISAIHVSLTSPRHTVQLVWTGPDAERMETGPFHSTPGAGLGYNDCDDTAESNRNNSNCTPKGAFAVQGFSDYLPSYPRCQYVTWFNMPRGIAFHSHWQLPRYPASHGCVRLERHVAQLIHNNSLLAQTRVTVGGTWSRRGR